MPSADRRPVGAGRGRLPNLFIVGAAKAGTTSLHSFLARQPGAFMSEPKEPRYFAYEGERAGDFAGPGADRLIEGIVRSRDAYERLFAAAGDAVAVGESSPAYLYSPVAAGRIRDAVPDAKIVIVLRDPAQRAYSHWIDNVSTGWEPVEDFQRCLELAPQREREHWWRKWDYIGHGRYAPQVARFLDAFPAEQVSIILFEELMGDPAAGLAELLAFAGLDPAGASRGLVRENAGGVARSGAVAAALSSDGVARSMARRLLPGPVRGRLRETITRRNRQRPALPAASRAYLCALYGEEITELERMIGRDLSAWRA